MATIAFGLTSSWYIYSVNNESKLAFWRHDCSLLGVFSKMESGGGGEGKFTSNKTCPL